MTPKLNQCSLININNKITKVILDIVIDIGLDITILLYLNSNFLFLGFVTGTDITSPLIMIFLYTISLL